VGTSLAEAVAKITEVGVSYFQGEQTLRGGVSTPMYITPLITSILTKAGRIQKALQLLQRRSYNPQLSQLFKFEPRKLMGAVCLQEQLL
jgi:hypothetical protein